MARSTGVVVVEVVIIGRGRGRPVGAFWESKFVTRSTPS